MKSYLPKTIVFLLALQAFKFNVALAQSQKVTGQIQDITKNPVPFAVVFLQKANTGAYADSLGNFSLAVTPGDKLNISAIGFFDTTYLVGKNEYQTIYLRRDIKGLANVNVKAQKKQVTTASSQDLSATDQQIISNTLNDWRVGEALSFSMVNSYLIKDPVSGLRTDKSFFSVSPASGGMYYGGLLPVFTHTESTKGSKFLFDDWVKGAIINSNDQVVDNEAYWFNYDKVAETLLVTQDKTKVIEVEQANIKVFDLKNVKAEYFFENLKLDNSMKYMQVLVKVPQGKYALYKSIKTKFKKNDYVNTGLTETGHNYDEYIDNLTYYIQQPNTKDLAQVDLKEKKLKNAFPKDQAKADIFFSQHRDMPIDENFVIELVKSLN